MGLFDKFKTITELSDREAYFGINWVVTVADGEASESEISALLTALRGTQLFLDCDEDELVNIVNKVSKVAHDNELDFIYNEANRELSLDQRKAAFTTAVELAFADGTVDASEEEYLESAYIGLGIPEEYVAKVLEVMEVRFSA